jgi:hypothetical protein
MPVARNTAFSTPPKWARQSGEERDTAALHLAAAVALGLLFAGSLTLFGGPLTDGIKALGPASAAQAQSADPARF